MENSRLDSDMPLDPPQGDPKEAWIPQLLSYMDSDEAKALFVESVFVNPLTSPIPLERIGWIDLRGYWTNTPKGTA